MYLNVKKKENLKNNFPIPRIKFSLTIPLSKPFSSSNLLNCNRRRFIKLNNQAAREVFKETWKEGLSVQQHKIGDTSASFYDLFATILRYSFS